MINMKEEKKAKIIKWFCEYNNRCLVFSDRSCIRCTEAFKNCAQKELFEKTKNQSDIKER